MYRAPTLGDEISDIADITISEDCFPLTLLGAWGKERLAT
jgi:hypothetical protein